MQLEMKLRAIDVIGDMSRLLKSERKPEAPEGCRRNFLDKVKH
jgi:hypothetical protein